MISVPELLWRCDQKAWIDYPGDTQERVLMNILRENGGTLYGKEYLFREIRDVEDFTRYVPLSMYQDLQPYIQAMISGEPQMLVSQPAKAWMKTSQPDGVRLFPYTGEVAKTFQEAFLRIYTECAAEGIVNEGKVITGLEGLSTDDVGGVPAECTSALMFKAMKKIPIVTNMVLPSTETAQIVEGEQRWVEIAAEVSRENVTGAVADPMLFLAFLRRMMTEYKEVMHLADIQEMWPSFSLIISDGDVTPYKSAFRSILGNVEFREVFCSDDLAVGIQIDDKGYVPLFDRCFLEFIPLKEWGDMEKDGGTYREYGFDSKTIDSVKQGEEYVLVMTTPGGLYRYITGDTVRVIDDIHIEKSGYVEHKEAGATHIAEQYMVLLREIARDDLDMTMEIENQVVAVESEALSYLFGIK
ncbi:MAG: GH3 auxin-responsive promoter family protein [Theionarchaea archaeon]|nr:GH3 auxin-responsive promoter family protein [Theionarchaea archaeon]